MRRRERALMTALLKEKVARLSDERQASLELAEVASRLPSLPEDSHEGEPAETDLSDALRAASDYIDDLSERIGNFADDLTRRLDETDSLF